MNGLKRLIEDAVAKTPDPREAAAIISAGLTIAERAELFDAILPTYVRVTIGRSRLTLPQGVATAATAPSNRSPRPAGRSAKVAAIRDWWARQLDTPYAVNGEWKHLRDLNRAEVLTVASERHAMAARNAAIAERFARLAEVMAQVGAETVADLSREDASAAWGEAA